MKKIVFAFALMASFGARAGDGKLKLTASIPNLPNGAKVILWGCFSHVKDSVEVINHGFTFNTDIKQGDMFILQVNPIGEPATDEHGTFLYLQPGTVSISGNGPYFKAAIFNGPSYLKEFQQVQAIMYDSTAFPGYRTLDERVEEARRVGDQDKYRELVNLQKDYDQRRLQLAKTWLTGHLNSPICGYVLNVFVDNHTSQETIRAFTEKLGPDAKNNFYIQKLLTRYSVNAATAVGKMAPVFTQPDVNGSPVSLADFKGKYVLLDFWASWCHPCRQLSPRLKVLYEKYKDRGFTILSVSLDTDKDKWIKAIADDQLSWTQVSDLSATNKVAALYGIFAIPNSLLIDPNGMIVHHGSDIEGLLEEKLEKK